MKSRHALTEDIIKIRRGLAIYKVGASPYWQCRMRISRTGGYICRSTQEISRIEARKSAEELYNSILQQHVTLAVLQEHTFDYFASKLIAKQYELAKRGVCSPKLAKSDEWLINNQTVGLLKFFGDRDITQIRTKDVNAYLEFVKNSRAEPFAFTTYSNRISCIRKILKIALYEGVIDIVPDTPRPEKKKDNPRPRFLFEPLVEKKDDQYKRILKTAEQMAHDQVVVRWIPVTMELYDLILFVMHTFVRPTISELYSIRHCDVTVAIDKPKRLILTIRQGKTGYRVTNTLEAAVSVYERIQDRYPNAKPEDYLFLPNYPNRETASRIIGRQFRELLKRAEIRRDGNGTPHSLYSLRHTALSMRLVKSKGDVNIFNLAQSAGTSVEQLERFYVRSLPPTSELARNLQTFGQPEESQPTQSVSQKAPSRKKQRSS
nr:tyrosine-type recombinase/integrase [Nitrosomonas nitrosa]